MNIKVTRRRMISRFAQIINDYVLGYKIPELVKHEKIKARRLSYDSQMYLLMLGQFLHVFTLTRRKNAVGALLGVTVDLDFPLAVCEKLTIRPSEENSDSLSSVAPMRVRYRPKHQYFTASFLEYGDLYLNFSGCANDTCQSSGSCSLFKSEARIVSYEATHPPRYHISIR